MLRIREFHRPIEKVLTWCPCRHVVVATCPALETVSINVSSSKSNARFLFFMSKMRQRILQIIRWRGLRHQSFRYLFRYVIDFSKRPPRTPSLPPNPFSDSKRFFRPLRRSWSAVRPRRFYLIWRMGEDHLVPTRDCEADDSKRPAQTICEDESWATGTCGNQWSNKDTIIRNIYKQKIIIIMAWPVSSTIHVQNIFYKSYIYLILKY